MSITSANATLIMTITNVYSAPQQIQGFGMDDAWMTSLTAGGDFKVGVDGFGTGGYIPRMPTTTLKLLADSASTIVFENWLLYQDQVVDITFAQWTLLLPSVKRKYTFYQGGLGDMSSLPDGKKMLEDREFKITWLPQGPGVPAISAAPM